MATSDAVMLTATVVADDLQALEQQENMEETAVHAPDLVGQVKKVLDSHQPVTLDELEDAEAKSLKVPQVNEDIVEALSHEPVALDDVEEDEAKALKVKEVNEGLAAVLHHEPVALDDVTEDAALRLKEVSNDIAALADGTTTETKDPQVLDMVGGEEAALFS